MKDLRRNIEISYLYRDAGNYKLFGSQVFSNAANLELEVVRRRIETKLIDGLYFVPECWGIDRLRFNKFDQEEDHDWHELVSIEFSSKVEETGSDIKDFLEKLELVSSRAV